MRAANKGQKSSYYDLDDIISTQERMPCKIETPVRNLGFLDPGSDESDLPKGAKMELPFWLTSALYSQRLPYISVDLPKVYKEGYREILEADANVVDLHTLGPYFYKVGILLLKLGHAESQDISKSLLQTFQTRLRKIMDSSQNTFNEDTTKLTEKLDETERQIFQNGQRGLVDFQRWETRASEKLQTSEMVTNHRKRKRNQMDN